MTNALPLDWKLKARKELAVADCLAHPPEGDDEVGIYEGMCTMLRAIAPEDAAEIIALAHEDANDPNH